MTRRRGWSDITVTDQFCGAGGSSIGAAKAGLRIRMAMNHWDLAIETHNTNFPDTDHDCTDISASDPRRYPSTDILITSPECTTHSPAGGNRRSKPQRDLFTPTIEDPAVARSRATMWDVCRFAEFHQYRRIIVENVIEAHSQWPLFSTWLQAMHVLGYRHKLLSLNSMFCWPTPQSRDRLYIHFWKKGDKAPDLDIRPKAPCPRCERVVEARQTWKQGALKRAAGADPVGKYRFQYVYTCPDCRTIVTPFYYAALNAIDFSIPAQRIGDRPVGKQLKDRTLERIRYGLEKYGRRQLVIRTNMTSGLDCRVRGLEQPHFAQTASWLDGLFTPHLVALANGGGDDRRSVGLDESMRTVHAGGNNHALVSPFVVNIQGATNRARGLDDVLPTQVAECGHDWLVQPGSPGFVFNVAGRDSSAPFDRPMPTQETREKFAVALVDPAFISVLRTHNRPGALDDPLATICTGGGHHLIVQGAAQIALRDASAMRVEGLNRELSTQAGAPQHAIVGNAPFITSYYGNAQASGSDEAIDTVTVRDRHAVVQPQHELRVEDCYFRMLQPHEIGKAMAFESDYRVLGNKRDRVKQYGNAVTPPAMEEQIMRTVQAMTGERVA
jgi:DNA (cytosine-5)-methyltransferase 1